MIQGRCPGGSRSEDSSHIRGSIRETSNVTWQVETRNKSGRCAEEDPFPLEKLTLTRHSSDGYDNILFGEAMVISPIPMAHRHGLRTDMSDPQTQIEQLCKQARECVSARKLQDAIAYYKQAIEIDELSQRAHEGLATAAFLTEDYELAEQHFKRLTMLDPRRSDALVNLGAVQNRKQDFAAAVKTLRQALSKDRKCAAAYYNLGIAYKAQNQASMAISAYKEAIRCDPQMAEAYHNLANTYVEMGNLQQAVMNFRRALEIKPNFEKARRGLEKAQALSEQKNQTANPFGRLVDVSQIAKKKCTSEQQRELTEEERWDDRQAVLNLATLFEDTSQKLLEQVRDELAPALLKVAHVFAQDGDRLTLAGADEQLESARDNYRTLSHAVLRCGDDLQAHEEQICNKLQTRAT